MEKYGDMLQNGAIVFVLFKKNQTQPSKSTTHYHDYSSMCRFFFFFFPFSAVLKPLLVSVVEQREEDTEKALSLLLAES